MQQSFQLRVITLLNLKGIVSCDYFQMDTEVHRVFVVP